MIAQSVFYSLFYAYPKSRPLLNNDMKRTLLDIFSEMFTAMQVKSATFTHWTLDTGTGNVLAAGGAKKGAKAGETKDYSLVDTKQKVNKTKREKV